MKDRHICIGVRLIIYDAPIEDDGEIGEQHQYFVDVDTDGSISFAAEYADSEFGADDQFPQTDLPAGVAAKIASFLLYAPTVVGDIAT
jgi:hypothetical protein